MSTNAISPSPSIVASTARTSAESRQTRDTQEAERRKTQIQEGIRRQAERLQPAVNAQGQPIGVLINTFA